MIMGRIFEMIMGRT